MRRAFASCLTAAAVAAPGVAAVPGPGAAAPLRFCPREAVPVSPADLRAARGEVLRFAPGCLARGERCVPRRFHTDVLHPPGTHDPGPAESASHAIFYAAHTARGCAVWPLG